MFKSIIAFCLSRRAILVFGLLLFAGAGFLAYRALNIEAYPNPAPVILEITAQAPGLSAEEMERYYTRPMEIGLYTTPGIQVIRSTSFYGLSFVRVVFRYGVDYNFAYSQAVIALQQNVSLPGNLVPNVQQNSGTGEIYRYQVIGPKHFGVVNLRTVSDWIVARRLLTIPGIAQINPWGGPTKEFDVEADPRQLEFYGVTVPQIVTALGNANINVGGREITPRPAVHQHPGPRADGRRRNGRFDPGLQRRRHRKRGLDPKQRRSRAGEGCREGDGGLRPRLGVWGRDQEDDAVAGIVVMNRTGQAHDMIPKVEQAMDDLNHDGSLPPGVKVISFYDRRALISVTTHTVLHNLIFGCLLVFLIQWVFLGNLRSALIVGINIPFALFFAIILLVIQGESANLLSVGAVDFGIIVDSAVILVENIFRNFQRDPEERQGLLRRLADGFYGPDPTTIPSHAAPVGGWTDRLRLILISAMQVDKAVLFAALITVAGFVPLFTMQGVEGAIFGPMARTYGYALAGALLATFTITPVLASFLLPGQVKETETIVVRALAPRLQSGAAVRVGSTRHRGRDRHRLSRRDGVPGVAARQRVSSEAGRRQFLDSLLDADDALAARRRGGDEKIAHDSPEISGSHYRDFPAWPARRRQRRLAVLQRRAVRAAQADGPMAQRHDQGETDRADQRGF